jgi:hypothetical protein
MSDTTTPPSDALPREVIADDEFEDLATVETTDDDNAVDESLNGKTTDDVTTGGEDQ